MIQDGPIYDNMQMVIQRLKDSFEDIANLPLAEKVNVLIQQNLMLVNLVEELFIRTDLSEYELGDWGQDINA